MRVPQNLRSGDLGFDMTPMIDVVFLLIIFFLVSSHLARQEAQMALPLPIADSGTKAEDIEGRRLTLNVKGDGEMILAGRPVTRQELGQRLVVAREAANGELEVRIRGDREVPYRHISPIMLSCARTGIWNVTIGVYRTEDAR
ncbi:MAG: biopolymer transporter ExbD [Pirellulaceae bacterium]|nr:biopolymer transporter ExbD [Planctomycetaceae bacterium]MDP6468247.1 biopolymer transporter ExbD [Pirellulaceae bacterium]MDP6553905.1 biopolymer transporter ExbD [Pirellulaceae bacterium]